MLGAMTGALNSRRIQLETVLWPLAALAISAALLLLVFYLLRVDPTNTNKEQQSFEAKQLTAAPGTLLTLNEGIELQAATGSQGLSVTAETVFSASDFPLFSYQFSGTAEGTQTFLLWRTAGNQAVFSLPLTWNDDISTTVDLSGNKDWQNTITGIGLYIAGVSSGQRIAIHDLRFQRTSLSSTLASNWSYWTRFRSWDNTSINRLMDNSIAADASPDISPTLAAGIWALLALPVLILLQALTRQITLASYAAVFLIPWIGVDLLWQANLLQQNVRTNSEFAGKNMREKHSVDIDGPIFIYSQRLLHNALPETPARIFITHSARGHNFLRLKLQYYLLPHNVFNYGQEPPLDSVRPGDYLISLGTTGHLHFDGNSTVSWGEGKSLTVVMLDQDPLGITYRVTAIPEHRR